MSSSPSRCSGPAAFRVDIAAGSTVLLFFAAGNRDHAQFDNPDRVDLTRGSPKRHLAFGHGIHFCVGAALARIEARTVLTQLLEQTQDFTLDPDHDPQWVDSLLVRRTRSSICTSLGGKRLHMVTGNCIFVIALPSSKFTATSFGLCSIRCPAT